MALVTLSLASVTVSSISEHDFLPPVSRKRRLDIYHPTSLLLQHYGRPLELIHQQRGRDLQGTREFKQKIQIICCHFLKIYIYIHIYIYIYVCIYIYIYILFLSWFFFWFLFVAVVVVLFFKRETLHSASLGCVL